MVMLGYKYIEKEYREHRTKILFSREKALMRETQREIEVELRKDEIQIEIDRKKIKQYDLRMEMNVMKTQKPEEFTQQRKEFSKKRKEIEEELRDLRESKKRLYKEAFVLGDWARKCSKEACPGFLNERWKCGICNTSTCEKCLQSMTPEEHVCKEEDKETAEYIKKDTKACPGCGTLIHKIDGCSQMWCPECHIAFDYNTMKVEKYAIHNPHFIEHQRQQGGGEAPRGREDVQYIYQLEGYYPIWEAQDFSEDVYLTLMEYHELMCVLNFNVLSKYPDEYMVIDNTRFRKQYLLGKMNEEMFKIKLWKREKEHLKKVSYRSVLYEFVAGVNGVFKKSTILGQNGDELTCEFASLETKCNARLEKISKVFGCHRAPTVRKML